MQHLPLLPFLLALAPLTLLEAPAAQATDWIQVTTGGTALPRRVGAPMAYEPAEHRVLLFGGLGTAGGTVWPTGSETWEYDGRNWRLLNPAAAPPPRAFTAMAFDAAHQRMVMFGGRQSGVSMNDTWTWDGATWTQVLPANSPPVQSGHSMTYDATRQRIVLFSGDAALPETWEFDGNDWTMRSPAHVPPGRSRSALAYDTRRERTVMFGGIDATSVRLNDTWEWDGTDWTQILPTNSPPIRSEHAMAWDAGRQRTVMFAGIDGSGSTLNDTWEWDGNDWTHAAPAFSPSARDGHAMAYDPERGVVVMYGGSTDTWEYGPTQPGDYVSYGEGCVGTDGRPELHAQADQRPYTGNALVLEATHLGNLPGVMTIGGSRGTWMGLALPFDLGQIGFTGCSLLASIDTTIPLVNLGGFARQVLAIPADPMLVGQRFYDQLILVTPTGLALSNGAAALIGAP